ncbi:MAG: GNAT family N-acetyltransferase [Burkholderiaceae bacterium]|nr:GNAT family N-acetyltransferase [Burkholderiaceae bacterium]
MTAHVDPVLLRRWLAARSVARGLPLPVACHGGWRVDTALPAERCRHVFAGPAPGIHALALTVDDPLTLIKMCGTGEQLLALMPPGWRLQQVGYLMVHDGAPMAAPPLPARYRLAIAVEGAATVARLFFEDGSLASSGYAVEHDGVFIFDTIVTEAPHRRRGLGKALIAALGATQQSSASRRVLVATEEGRDLYLALGWEVLSPYATVKL